MKRLETLASVSNKPANRGKNEFIIKTTTIDGQRASVSGGRTYPKPRRATESTEKSTPTKARTPPLGPTARRRFAYIDPVLRSFFEERQPGVVLDGLQCLEYLTNTTYA
jgi:hypothetical protein